MITEKDLQEAIAECNGVRNPDSKTCIKLAAFLIIQREMFGKPEEALPIPSYSYAEPPVERAEPYIDYRSETEFSKVIDGKKPGMVWSIMDELMSTLQAVYPRLYDAVMRQLTE